MITGISSELPKTAHQIVIAQKDDKSHIASTDLFFEDIAGSKIIGPKEKEKDIPKSKQAPWFEASKKFKKLHVYDFDDTLVQTPKQPKRGEPRYGWDGKDWWGSHESLQPPFLGNINYHYHQIVLDAYNKSIRDSEVFTIILTGRRGVVAWAVRNLLAKIGIYGKRVVPESNAKAVEKFKQLIEQGKDQIYPAPNHHEYFTSDFVYESDYPKNTKGKPQHGTIYHKTYIVSKLLHAQMEELVLWDDRNDHIRPFIALSLDFLQNKPNLKSAQINRVFPIYKPVWNNGNCSVIEIPIKPGMRY